MVLKKILNYLLKQKKKISDLNACVLKRPRHDHIVKD